jgi:oxalate decarboxylase/phosphoglucose isomerase-like protein (cupin superfamily)
MLVINRRLFLLARAAVVCALASPTPLGAQAPSGITRNQLLANDRVTVMRLTAAAGLTEEMHITPQDVVAIQTGAGEIEMRIGKEVTKGAPGRVWYLPKTIEHALFNRGTQPVDMLVVLLSNNAAAIAAPSPQPRGTSEASATSQLIDNDRVRVMKVPAPVGLKQEMHKSTEDLIAIQSTPGQIDVAVASERMRGEPWKVWYLPNTLDHAISNPGTTPVEMLVIALK